MYPEKYYKDLEKSGRKESFLKNLSIASVFLAFFLVGGQLVHELGHIAVLVFYDCFYNIEPGFSLLNGFYASIQPICTLNDTQLLLFYSIGYIGTIVMGSAFSVLGLKREDNFEASFFTAAGTGAFLSIMLTIGGHGDIERFLDILGVDPFYNLPVKLFFMLGILSTSLKNIGMILERQD